MTNVTIKEAFVKTLGGSGIGISNFRLSYASNINIQGTLIKKEREDTVGYGFPLSHVKNSTFNLKLLNETNVANGMIIVDCENVNLNVDIQNVYLGMLIEDNKNIKISGSIQNCIYEGIKFFKGNADTIYIDVVIKNALTNLAINSGSVGKNIDVTGDFSKDETGTYCIRIEGTTENVKLHSLNMSGWSSGTMVYGNGQVDLQAYDCDGYTRRDSIDGNDNYCKGTVVYNKNPATNNIISWLCLQSGKPGMFREIHL